jgi:hypothetical protein
VSDPLNSDGGRQAVFAVIDKRQPAAVAAGDIAIAVIRRRDRTDRGVLIEPVMAVGCRRTRIDTRPIADLIVPAIGVGNVPRRGIIRRLKLIERIIRIGAFIAVHNHIPAIAHLVVSGVLERDVGIKVIDKPFEPA